MPSSKATKLAIQKIISGGQTGVDRAALDFALKYGIPCGGWVPKGRKALDGPISMRYPVQEHASPLYPPRTEANVREADATLIICSSKIGRGTALTIRLCEKNKTPFLVIQDDKGDAREWLEQVKPKILNIAGSSEKSWPGAYQAAMEILHRAFDK